jgi:hypothetical protein
MQKRTYSTGLKIKYKLGILTKDVKSQIHRNTRYYWKTHFDINQVFGIDDFDEDEDNIRLIKTNYENERLKKMVLVLSKTYLILISLVRTFKHKKYLIFQQKTNIIRLINEYQGYFGVKRLSGLFDISTKRYYTWKYLNNLTLLKKSVKG